MSSSWSFCPECGQRLIRGQFPCGHAPAQAKWIDAGPYSDDIGYPPADPAPPQFCKILEPNNPDFTERFACKDCGENFITMCSYARVKAEHAAKLKPLLLAVGEMAETLLCFDSYVDPESPGAVFCSRCFVYSQGGLPIEHHESCLVGRVLGLCDELIKSYPEGSFAPDPTLDGLRKKAQQLRKGRHVELFPVQHPTATELR